MPSIQDCLQELQCDLELLQTCQTLDEEWGLIRKAYFKRVLRAHPDKGGDAETFRRVQAAWETLRKSREGSRSTFFSSAQASTEKAQGYEATFENFDGTTQPSWDYYYAAAEEEQPIHIIELAKSGRSACVNASKNPKLAKCVPVVDIDDDGGGGGGWLAQNYPMNAAGKYLIAKGEVRVGTFNKVSGTYTWFRHLRCWRVPSKVWLGLPDPEQAGDVSLFVQALASMNTVLFSGFAELDSDHQIEVARHVMNKEHWARLVKPKKKKVDSTTLSVHEGTSSSATSSSSTSSSSMVAATGASSRAVSNRKVFVMPRPGENGAEHGALEGKTIVLTGIFPEVGGGAGLSLGKAKVKAMLQSFGARVTSSVSGRTDILVVGKAPGMSKVSKARSSASCRLVSLEDMKLGLETHAVEDLGKKKMLIENFSKGYGYRSGGFNGLADKASPEELAIAQGLKPVPAVIKNKRKTKSKAKVGTKKKKVTKQRSKAASKSERKRTRAKKTPSMSSARKRSKNTSPGSDTNSTTLVVVAEPPRYRTRAQRAAARAAR